MSETANYHGENQTFNHLVSEDIDKKIDFLV